MLCIYWFILWTSENAVKTQIYAAIIAYCLVVIVKEIIVWKIPPKGVIISDFICTFAMLLMIIACLDLQHKGK